MRIDKSIRKQRSDLRDHASPIAISSLTKALLMLRKWRRYRYATDLVSPGWCHVAKTIWYGEDEAISTSENFV